MKNVFIIAYNYVELGWTWIERKYFGIDRISIHSRKTRSLKFVFIEDTLLTLGQ